MSEPTLLPTDMQTNREDMTLDFSTTGFSFPITHDIGKILASIHSALGTILPAKDYLIRSGEPTNDLSSHHIYIDHPTEHARKVVDTINAVILKVTRSVRS
jgi:hypothetical protein